MIFATNFMVFPIETEIIIPGVSQTYTFLQVSDMYITLAEEAESDLVKESAADRLSVFTGQDGIVSDIRFRCFLKYAKEINANGLLLSGDIADFPSLGNFHSIKTALEKSELDYLYVYGNHDWSYSWNYFDKEACESSDRLYAELLGGNPLYQIKDYGEFSIMAIDNSKDVINQEQLDAYKKEAAKGNPIILMFHVPITQPYLADVSNICKGKDICMQRDPALSNEGDIGGGVMQYVTGSATDGSCRKIVIKGA